MTTRTSPFDTLVAALALTVLSAVAPASTSFGAWIDGLDELVEVTPTAEQLLNELTYDR